MVTPRMTPALYPNNYKVCDKCFSEEFKFVMVRNRTDLKVGRIPTLNLTGNINDNTNKQIPANILVKTNTFLLNTVLGMSESTAEMLDFLPTSRVSSNGSSPFVKKIHQL